MLAREGTLDRLESSKLNRRPWLVTLQSVNPCGPTAEFLLSTTSRTKLTKTATAVLISMMITPMTFLELRTPSGKLLVPMAKGGSTLTNYVSMLALTTALVVSMVEKIQVMARYVDPCRAVSASA